MVKLWIQLFTFIIDMEHTKTNTLSCAHSSRDLMFKACVRMNNQRVRGTDVSFFFVKSKASTQIETFQRRCIENILTVKSETNQTDSANFIHELRNYW